MCAGAAAPCPRRDGDSPLALRFAKTADWNDVGDLREGDPNAEKDRDGDGALAPPPEKSPRKDMVGAGAGCAAMTMSGSPHATHVLRSAAAAAGLCAASAWGGAASVRRGGAAAFAAAAACFGRSVSAGALPPAAPAVKGDRVREASPPLAATLLHDAATSLPVNDSPLLKSVRASSLALNMTSVGYRSDDPGRSTSSAEKRVRRRAAASALELGGEKIVAASSAKANAGSSRCASVEEDVAPPPLLGVREPSIQIPPRAESSRAGATSSATESSEGASSLPSKRHRLFSKDPLAPLPMRLARCRRLRGRFSGTGASSIPMPSSPPLTLPEQLTPTTAPAPDAATSSSTSRGAAAAARARARESASECWCSVLVVAAPSASTPSAFAWRDAHSSAGAASGSRCTVSSHGCARARRASMRRVRQA